jgi:hypothetical protein
MRLRANGVDDARDDRSEYRPSRRVLTALHQHALLRLARLAGAVDDPLRCGRLTGAGVRAGKHLHVRRLAN